MKLPKKLDIMDLLDLKEEYLFEQLFYKVNELRDYLSDKEASKGECICGVGAWRSDCPYAHIKLHSPQQEESKHAGDIAWCDCECHTKGSPQPKCDKCYPKEESRVVCDCGRVFEPGDNYCQACLNDKPQLKEESPKEDEDKLLDTIIDYELSRNSVEGLKYSVRGYLLRYYVSKIKIKTYVSKNKYRDVADSYENGHNQALENLVKPQGLEEL